MRIRTLLGGTLAAAALAGSLALATPAGATTGNTIGDIAAASLADNPGGAATDSNWYDFDILANAVVASGLLPAAQDPNANLTVFAPNDRAFQVLVASLGGGWRNEAGVLDFLVNTVGLPTVKNVVLYHILPQALTAQQLAGRTNIPTLLPDANIQAVKRVPFTSWLNVVDNDPNAINGLVYKSIPASNGIIHVTAFVLRPVDLPPTAS